MTAANFPYCLQTILGYEGGFVDNPADPGGATNMGITLGTYRLRYDVNATVDDLRAITADQVAAIYRAFYWGATECDALPSGVDLIVFYQSVNSGPRRAAETVQEALGVTVDGIIGPQTLKAATDDPRGAAGLIQDISALRLAFYRNLPTYDTFGKGWTNRLTDVTAKALALAQTSPAQGT